MLFNKHTEGAFIPSKRMTVSPYELICVKDKAEAQGVKADTAAADTGKGDSGKPCNCGWAAKWPKACVQSADDGSRCWGA